MNIFKKFVCVVVAIVCLISPVTSFAQTTTDVNPVNRVPVFVNDLQLQQNPVQAGEAIKGTFTLANGGDRAASNVYYSIELRQGSALYSEKLVGPLFVNQNEVQKQSFEVNIPTGLAGNDFKIRIHAQLKTGEKLGWQEQSLQILGTNEYAKITKSALYVNGVRYVPSTGPTVHKDEKATYKLTVSNPGTKKMTYVPTVTVYDRSNTSEALSTTKAPEVTLAPKQQTEISIDLPLFDNKPNVYLANLVLNDVNGSPRSEQLQARYIIEGPIATIHTITADKQSVNKKDSINLTVTYTGTPVDISVAQQKDPIAATLRVSVLDQNNQVIGTKEEQIQLSASGDQKILAIEATGSSNRISAKAEIVKDGQVINTYSTSLSPAEMPVSYFGQVPSMKTGLITFGLGALLTLIVMAIRHFRRKNPTQFPPMGSMGPMVVLVMAATLATAIVISSSVQVYAFNGNNDDPANVTFVSSSATPFTKKSPCQDCASFDIFLNTPNSHLQVNQPFTLSGSWSFYACENTPPTPTIFVTMPNGSPIQFNVNSDLQGHDGRADSTFSLTSNQFKFGSPGTYKVHMKFQTSLYDNNTKGVRYQIMEGDLQITVDAPNPTANTNLEVVRIGADDAIIGGGSAQPTPASWFVSMYKEPFDYSTKVRSSNNPAVFSNISPTPTREIRLEVMGNDQNHASGSYDVSYATCLGSGCIPSSASYVNVGCTDVYGDDIWIACQTKIKNFSLTANQTKRLFVKYVPKMNNKVIVYRILPDGSFMSPVSYPIRVSSSFVSGGNTAADTESGSWLTSNPATFTNLKDSTGSNPGIHDVGIDNQDFGSVGLDYKDYQITAASCSFDTTVNTDCELGAYQTATMSTDSSYHYDENNAGTFYCDGRPGYEYISCGYKYDIGQNTIRKIYFKYSAKTQPPATLGASCALNPSEIQTGGSATWSASGVNGGTAPYTYTWGGSASGSGSLYTGTFNTAGTYNATLKVNSADGQSTGIINCPSLTVSDAPIDTNVTVSCRPTNPLNGNTIYQAPSGQPVRWIADASNGASSGFVWGGSVTGIAKEVTVVYTTTGIKTANVSYNGGAPVNCSVSNFRISTQPGYREF